MIQSLRDCFADARENLEQQILRLSCPGGTSVLSPRITYDTKGNPILYELPGTGKPVNAPLDATKLDPGVKPTVTPAPAGGEAVQPAGDENKVVKWAKDNPILAGGVVVLALYLLARKGKR